MSRPNYDEDYFDTEPSTTQPSSSRDFDPESIQDGDYYDQAHDQAYNQVRGQTPWADQRVPLDPSTHSSQESWLSEEDWTRERYHAAQRHQKEPENTSGPGSAYHQATAKKSPKYHYRMNAWLNRGILIVAVLLVIVLVIAFLL